VDECETIKLWDECVKLAKSFDLEAESTGNALYLRTSLGAFRGSFCTVREMVGYLHAMDDYTNGLMPVEVHRVKERRSASR
jgi:hypothetical protein